MSGLLDQALDPLAAALKVTGYRQQLVSANIANANTPNYRAVDIPFAQVMQAVQAGDKGSLPLTTDSNRQFSETGNNASMAAFVQYQRGSQVGLDNNSVDMNREQADFLQNSVRYQADLTFLTGKIKTLTSAITGTTA
ncbi:flagellar basal body rod protein FlgB [Acidithiobacillus thiooxidans]|uniref:Flagellar basal body rod protein FlgB n=1 Tax=Acidithiobacillus thiooxidans ATCC 19377 TaxID=637390 RepID=A0A5P9XQF1_ACITH|nr:MULTISPECIES: flagellar basal body rod protein FlgB [Acidithiobacillus]MBE7565552.1 flagellar basal body rod protein FlgB [Acidithiobacillus sp. HP-11]MBU2740343.1 flagellar basal body rod protein FlgB [Acidithiobacillus albertensis]MBU2749488.1 flagellar basal body rod protein FlgB [Acidithiobacillus thiooxidans]MBU2794932.1 flagellar basal body rod protein FlgB [Acidithiobacillus thiooxidans]MBU2834838.1 flagellar basal body rod protein FlgB [Acidithiobacillus thiooxidans]